jgi:hypothetical protein
MKSIGVSLGQLLALSSNAMAIDIDCCQIGKQIQVPNKYNQKSLIVDVPPNTQVVAYYRRFHANATFVAVCQRDNSSSPFKAGITIGTSDQKWEFLYSFGPSPEGYQVWVYSVINFDEQGPGHGLHAFPRLTRTLLDGGVGVHFNWLEGWSNLDPNTILELCVTQDPSRCPKH